MSGTNAPAARIAASRGFAIRLAVFFAAMFAVFGIHLPYYPIWLDAMGLSATQISVVLAVPAVLRMASTPAIAFAADRWQLHRTVLIAAAVFALAASLLLNVTSGFLPILLVSIALGAATATLIPLSETIAMTGVRAAGLDYGRMRLWGSLTFIAGNFFGAYAIVTFGNGAIVWAIAGCLVATVLAALLLPEPMLPEGLQAQSRRPMSLAGAVRLVTSRPFVLFIAVAATLQATHAVMYAFGSLHWRTQGISSGWIGALWAIGIIVEIGVFAVSGRIARAVGPLGLMLIAALAGLVRWTLMTLDPPLGTLVALQMLHGATYGAAHLGAMQFLTRAVPEHQAGTAQAIYATTTGGAIAVVTLGSGPLFTALAGKAYGAMALLAALSIVALALLHKSWDRAPIERDHPHSAGSGGDTVPPA